MRFPTWGARISQAPILETDADGRLGICRTASGPSAVDRRSRKEACLLMGRFLPARLLHLFRCNRTFALATYSNT